MRLIDADALIEGRVDNDPVVIDAMCAPTIDAVAVVRCRNCRYADCDAGGLWCTAHDIAVQPDDYCSAGGRKRCQAGVDIDAYYDISRTLGFSTR